MYVYVHSEHCDISQIHANLQKLAQFYFVEFLPHIVCSLVSVFFSFIWHSAFLEISQGISSFAKQNVEECLVSEQKSMATLQKHQRFSLLFQSRNHCNHKTAFSPPLYNSSSHEKTLHCIQMSLELNTFANVSNIPCLGSLITQDF